MIKLLSLALASVSVSPGDVVIDVGSHSGTFVGDHVAETGDLAVRATTIDETMAKLGLQSVDFIKMDIEGAERHALAVARRTLARFRPRMVICTYHRRDDADVVTKAVLDAQPGYGVQTTDSQAYFFPAVGS